MSASKGGHTEVVEILLQQGANVDMQEAVSTGITFSMECFILNTMVSLYVTEEQHCELVEKWY